MSTVMVFAPSPLLTVTIENGQDVPEVHLHAGGQGLWLARMVESLGVSVVLCASFGGESGAVVRTLVEREGVTVRAVVTEARNGAYVHDRRGGERASIAEVASSPLNRHEVDELYAVSVVEGLESEVCVLGGPTAPEVVPAGVYRRLAADLRRCGRTVVADLSGDPLRAAVEGGVSVLKVSHEELIAHGLASSADTEHLVEAMNRLRADGAERVVVSRADLPTLSTSDGRIVEVVGPRLEPVDVRGGGDSLTAGLAAALARGESWEEALRLGVAAGSLNVTRRGLGTGGRREIERLARHVEVRSVDADASAGTESATPEQLADKARPR